MSAKGSNLNGKKYSLLLFAKFWTIYLEIYKLKLSAMMSLSMEFWLTAITILESSSKNKGFLIQIWSVSP